ncbi:MAG TPA: BON domain-containing protein [Gemmatimonadaceae bacterium]|nr:BON domain-containing protein [Gemmatimonadaceae bacterium]
MSYLRFQDEEESSVAGTVTSVLLGAVAGFAVGMLVAQRVGGFSGLASRVRRGLPDGMSELAGSQPAVADDYSDFDDYEDDELEASEEGSELEERVLEAFRNDPILSERAIDIGGIGEETIELAGWVTTEDEAEHAVVLARGVPGVGTVLNRIVVGEEEERIEDHTRRFAQGDDALTEAHWDGHTVGTGRRRQGTSDEPDRHVDPRVELKERWTSADVELEQAADDTSGIAERRHREKKTAKGDRTGGSPVSPTGVPKADHVAKPTDRTGA